MTRPSTSATEHLFTVDVEEYFHVSAFETHVSRDRWDAYPSRVEQATDLLLEELDGVGAKGTFFTLGWVAATHPALVRRISDGGHEIASHGWWHYRVNALEEDEFRLEIRRSKQILEDITGRPVYGHRAPSFSIVPGTEWAFDVLIEEGYRYDSSLFPIRRFGYGYPGARRAAHTITREGGTLLELPMATTRWAGVRLPAAGGAYLRLLPFALTRRAFREHRKNGESAVFYVHPWEVDPDQPRLSVSPTSRLRHYGGLRRTMPRLRRLLEEFRFTSIERRFDLNREKPSEQAGLAVPTV